MHNRQFGRLVGDLIRTRRALKQLKTRDTHLTSQIKAELASRMVGGHSTSMGDVMLYDRPAYAIGLLNLLTTFTRAEVVHGNLVKPQITNLRTEMGDRWIEEHCDRTMHTALLTKPAKKKAKVKIILPGHVPAI